MENEAHKKGLKVSMINLFDHVFFSERNFVLLYDQDKETLGLGKLNSMWIGSYIISRDFKKGDYEFTYYEGNKLVEPRNGVYLKNYYA